MNKKQKALLQTIGAITFIITVNQFIEGVNFQTVYTSSHPNGGAIETKLAGEGSQQTSLESQATPSSPEKLIKEVFGDQADVAIAIAKAESGLNPEAVGDLHITFEKDGKLMGMSCGTFQIRVLEGRPDCETLKDLRKNVEYAKRIYEARGDFTAWSTYNNGAYKKYL